LSWEAYKTVVDLETLAVASHQIQLGLASASPQQQVVLNFLYHHGEHPVWSEIRMDTSLEPFKPTRDFHYSGPSIVFSVLARIRPSEPTVTYIVLTSCASADNAGIIMAGLSVRGIQGVFATTHLTGLEPAGPTPGYWGNDKADPLRIIRFTPCPGESTTTVHDTTWGHPTADIPNAKREVVKSLDYTGGEQFRIPQDLPPLPSPLPLPQPNPGKGPR
jgi:hypothetical protein